MKKRKKIGTTTFIFVRVEAISGVLQLKEVHYEATYTDNVRTKQTL